MSPNEPKPGKPAKQQDAVQKLNVQVLKAQQLAKDIGAMIAASLGASPKAPLATSLAEASTTTDALDTAAGAVSAALLRLHKDKWTPVKRGRNDFVAGSLVTIRDHRLSKFDGAWEKADLKHLVVVSIHGKRAKVQIQRDGLKGECIGLVPAHWLMSRAA